MANDIVQHSSSSYNAALLLEEIKNEFYVDEQGVGYISRRGLARLCGVDESSIRYLLRETLKNNTPFALEKYAEWDFDSAGEIKDTIATDVIYHYALKGRTEARNLDKVLRDFALRTLFREYHNWKPQKQHPAFNEDDIKRIDARDTLRTGATSDVGEMVKTYLLEQKIYHDKIKRGIYFAKVHNTINVIITTETSKQMKARAGTLTGKKLTDNDLIRDYYPWEILNIFNTLCIAAVNLFDNSECDPITAIRDAAKVCLPKSFEAKPINFERHISELKVERAKIEAYYNRSNVRYLADYK